MTFRDFAFEALRMRYIRGMHDATRDHGLQPLDGLLTRWGITNHELVEASVEQLNHKQVQKARKGRQLTLHLMQKLTRTLNDAALAKIPKEQRVNFKPYLHKHLFNYAKGHDPAWQSTGSLLRDPRALISIPVLQLFVIGCP